MDGTACPTCGQYFRKDRRELAAQHLIGHDQMRVKKLSYFDFNRPVSIGIFAVGALSLALSLSVV